MTNVKRYNPHSSIDVSAWIVEDAEGAVVLAVDYQKLDATLAEWIRMRNEAMAVATSNRARINDLEVVMKSIAMATEPGALYESIAIHNTATQALRGSQSETPALAQEHFKGDKVPLTAQETELGTPRGEAADRAGPLVSPPSASETKGDAK